MFKRIIPGIKNAGLIALAILLACVFIWQRIAMQNLSAEISKMEKDIRQLEKNRDYLKGEIQLISSFDQIKNRAFTELGMVNSNEKDVVIYSDSLTSLARSRSKLIVPLENKIALIQTNTADSSRKQDLEGLGK
jgi:cell division protein FtsB